MKTILLSLSILFITSTFSQVFAPIEAEWRYHKISNFDSTIHESVSLVNEDSLFEGREAKRMGGIASPPFPCPVFLDTFFISTSNDSVFIYEAGRWQLMVNFNAKVSDTFSIDFEYSQFPNTAINNFQYIVDSIGSMKINNHFLRSVYLKEINPSTSVDFFDGWFTERIGHQFSIVPWVNASCAYGSYYDYGLKYYQDSTLGQIYLNENKINSLVGLEEENFEPQVKNLNPRVFPNPAKERLNIHCQNNHVLKEVQLFDLTGRAHQVQLLKESALFHSINLEGLKSGVYLLQMEFDNNDVFSKKLIIN